MNRAPRGSGPFFAGEIRLELRVLEHEPGAEPAHVAVAEPGAVVELEHRALVARRLESEAAGHAQVDEQRKPALQAEHEVLPAPLDGHDRISLELLGHLEEVDRPREAGIEDLDAHERPPDEPRLELRADRLDLRKLRHAGRATR